MYQISVGSPETHSYLGDSLIPPTQTSDCAFPREKIRIPRDEETVSSTGCHQSTAAIFFLRSIEDEQRAVSRSDNGLDMGASDVTLNVR